MKIQNRISIISLFLTLGIIISVSLYPSVVAETIIPSWIKETASWWSSDEIEDSEFINAIQWLISKEIIVIPQTENIVEKKYLTKESKFSMWQPTNWERQIEKPHPLFGTPLNEMIELGTITQIYPTNIGIFIDDLGDLSFQEYLDEIDHVGEDVVSSMGGNLKIMESGFTTISGENAYWESYIIEVFDQSIKGQTIYVAHKGEVYIMSLGASEENFNDHFIQFKEIMKTFKFLA